MSIKDIENYLQRHSVCAPERDSDCICVLLSDSKASRLEQLADNLSNFSLVYLYKKGASTVECYNLLCSNLPKIEAKYSKRSLVYVWTGTCDITCKGRSGCIRVRSKTDRIVDSVIEYYWKIINFVLAREGKVKFIGVPTYSLSIYNSYRGARISSEENLHA